MTQTDTLYVYLRQNYDENEPIFLSDIYMTDMKNATVRQYLKKLITDGRLKRFDTGIYYIPKKSVFRSGSTLSAEDVIRKKYLMNETGCCGYLGGMLFANRIGITTQVPMVYEVYTNKATTEYRETMLANLRVIIKRPYVSVNDQNVNTLQFLDLLKEVTDISELEGKELTNCLLGYMKKKKIRFDSISQYLSYYPDRIYKNMYEVGLLKGVSS